MSAEEDQKAKHTKFIDLTTNDMECRAIIIEFVELFKNQIFFVRSL